MSAMLHARDIGQIVREPRGGYYTCPDGRRWHSISTVCRALTPEDMSFATASSIRNALNEYPPDMEKGWESFQDRTNSADILAYMHESKWPVRAMMRTRQGHFDRGNLVDELVGGLATGDLPISDAVTLLDWIQDRYDARAAAVQASSLEYGQSPEGQRPEEKPVYPYPFDIQSAFDWCWPAVKFWSEAGWTDCAAQVQVRHEVTLSKNPRRLAGTLDIIGRDPEGRLRVMEVKTKAGGGTPPPHYTAQASAYHRAAEAIGYELDAPPMFLVISPEGWQTYDMTMDHLERGWDMFLAALLALDSRDGLPTYKKSAKR